MASLSSAVLALGTLNSIQARGVLVEFRRGGRILRLQILNLRLCIVEALRQAINLCAQPVVLGTQLAILGARFGAFAHGAIQLFTRVPARQFCGTQPGIGVRELLA